MKEQILKESGTDENSMIMQEENYESLPDPIMGVQPSFLTFMMQDRQFRHSRRF